MKDSIQLTDKICLTDYYGDKDIKIDVLLF